MAKFRTVKSSTQAAAYNNGTGLKGGLTSFSGNQIQPRVKIGSASNAAGSILKAKGSRKFQVTDGATLEDEYIVAGNTYMISSVSNTDWAALGVKGVAAVGGIFVASKSGSGLATDGQVFLVGNCTLVDKANGSLAASEMNIQCTRAVGGPFYAKRITNKYVWDFADNKYRVGSTAAAATATSIEIVAVARA